MKRRSLVAHLRKHGCELLREGSRHANYWNPMTRVTSAVPRHTEIANLLAVKICRDLNIPAP
jgi:hypothetical protein